MKAKQFLASGIVAAMLGFGPTVASADPYFGLFYGHGSIDVSRGDLDQTTSLLVQSIDGSAPAGRSSVDDTDRVWGVQVGYRFNRWVAAEIGYVDLGRADYTANVDSTFTGNPDIPDGAYNFDVTGRLLMSGPTAAVLGMVALGERFDIYARGGILFADTRLRMKGFVGPGYSVEWKASSEELFGGLGFAWNINEDYALRAEGTYFLDVGDSDRTGESSVAMFAIGFLFR